MRKLVLLVLLSGWAFVAAYAQSTTNGPTTFGGGQQPTLGYGNSTPTGAQNALSLSLAGTTGYDDNVLYSNVNKQGDEFFEFSSRLTYLRQGKRFKFDVDYDPYVTLYRRITQWDTVNQGLNTDFSYQLSPHWIIQERNRAYYYYISGAPAPYTGSTPFPPLGSPSSVNDFIYIPGARAFSGSGRLDLVYQYSGRTSVDFFGSYLDSHFSSSQTAAYLSNWRDAQGGVNYSYRLGRQDTVGIVYTYDQMQFGGGITQQKIHSWMASYAHQLSPSVSFTVFGGPEYVRSHTTVNLSIPIFGVPVGLTVPLNSNGWYAAGGGDLAWHGSRTSAVLMGQHMITGGFGFQGAGTYTLTSFNVGRRLTERWSLTPGVGYARFSVLSVATAQTPPRMQSVNADLHLTRDVNERLKLDFAYTYWLQRGYVTNPLYGNIDRNRASIGFVYTLGKVLGQ